MSDEAMFELDKYKKVYKTELEMMNRSNMVPRIGIFQTQKRKKLHKKQFDSSNEEEAKKQQIAQNDEITKLFQRINQNFNREPKAERAVANSKISPDNGVGSGGSF